MIRWPGPDALAHNPELASLALLEAATIVLRATLICAQPELRDIGDPTAQDSPPDSAAHIALGLITLLDTVAELGAAYRDAVGQERLEHRRAVARRDF